MNKEIISLFESGKLEKAKEKVLKMHPAIDQESFNYFCFYWANIMVLINQ